MPTTYRTFQRRGFLSRRGCDRLNQVLSGCAELYNAELEEWRRSYKECGNSDSLFDRMKAFTRTRSQDPFWGTLSVDIGAVRSLAPKAPSRPFTAAVRTVRNQDSRAISRIIATARSSWNKLRPRWSDPTGAVTQSV